MSGPSKIDVPVFAEGAPLNNPLDVRGEATIVLERNEKTAEIFIRTTPGSVLYDFLAADGDLKFLTLGGQKIGVDREEMRRIHEKLNKREDPS